MAPGPRRKEQRPHKRLTQTCLLVSRSLRQWHGSGVACCRVGGTECGNACMGHFITGDWNAKVGNQEIPGVIGKFGLGVQNEAGQRLIEFCQENVLVIENTLFQQHKRRLYTWTSPDGQHRNQIDCILCSQRWRSSIESAKPRPGGDCGSDHELLIAKFRLKLKKSRENHYFGF